MTGFARTGGIAVTIQAGKDGIQQFSSESGKEAPASWSFPPPSQPAAASYGNLLKVNLLSFNLYIREGQQIQEIWPDLRFGAGPNYWLDKLVPPLEQLQSELRQLDTTQHNVPGLDPTRSSRLGTPASQTGGSDASRFYYFPLEMGDLPGPDEFTGPLPDASDTNLRSLVQVPHG